MPPRSQASCSGCACPTNLPFTSSPRTERPTRMLPDRMNLVLEAHGSRLHEGWTVSDAGASCPDPTAGKGHSFLRGVDEAIPLGTLPRAQRNLHHLMQVNVWLMPGLKSQPLCLHWDTPGGPSDTQSSGGIGCSSHHHIFLCLTSLPSALPHPPMHPTNSSQSLSPSPGGLDLPTHQSGLGLMLLYLLLDFISKYKVPAPQEGPAPCPQIP